VSFGIIPVEAVVEFIRSKPDGMDLILTGRYASAELMDIADTVTEMKEIKHHYNSGVQMRKGIEY
jgi:cob(I)alamin adenosyltransferase